LKGKPAQGVTAKDVMLYIMAQEYSRQGNCIGKVLEFSGEGLLHLNMDERATLTNLAVECGATTGIIEADDVTKQYLMKFRGWSEERAEAFADACRQAGRPCHVHTGRYADAAAVDQPRELARLIEGTAFARQLGLRVNAGHGLTYQNVEPVAAIPGIEELNIGHTIVARALAVGLEVAVRQMKALIQNPRRDPLFGSTTP
jgi:hypothetical protein